MKRQIRARDTEDPNSILHPLYELIRPLITNYTFWFFFGLVFIILVIEMLLEIFAI